MRLYLGYKNTEGAFLVKSFWSRRTYGFICLLIMFSLAAGPGESLLLPQKAEAAPMPLELIIEAGYEGKAQEGQWFPVQFTITNPGNDLEGDFVVQIAETNGGKDTAYIRQVTLPSNSSKVVKLTLPGRTFNKTNNQIYFYEDSLKRGKVVPFKDGSEYIRVSSVSAQSLQVGVLARDPDTMNFLALLNQKGYLVNIYHFDEKQFPEEPLMLDGLDVIIINDFASDRLSGDQVKAITSWTAQGGALIIAGGAGFPKTAEAFEAILPVQYRGTTTLSELSSLAKDAGKPLTIAEPFTVSDVSVLDGEVMYAEKDVALFVQKPWGKGSAIYAAYDLALNPIASWDGNPSVWEKVLSAQLMPVNNNVNRVYFGSGGFWEIDRSLDYFSALVPPSFGILALMLLIYIIFVAPLLYFLLKKIDKREWAWIVIPVISIFSSLCIFMIGASDRSSILSQALNIVELTGTGQASQISATSVFVPKGGEYELEFTGKKHISKLYRDGGGGNGQLSGTSDMWIYSGRDAARIQFRDVPYWSIRKALVEDSQLNDIGKFDYTINMSASDITGEITNRTQQNVTELNFIMNEQIIRVGDLRAGETKTFNSPIGRSSIMNYGDIANLLFPYRGPSDNWEQARSLLSTAMYLRSQDNKEGQPLIIALSKNKASIYKVNGKPVQTDQVNLLIQEMQIGYVQGNDIYIPFGSIHPVITTNNLEYTNFIQDGRLDIGQGDFTFEYRLPPIVGAHYEQFINRTPLTMGIALEIWNARSKVWEKYDPAQISEELDPALYLIDGRTIRMKATNKAQNSSFMYPDFAWRGTVRR